MHETVISGGTSQVTNLANSHSSQHCIVISSDSAPSNKTANELPLEIYKHKREWQRVFILSYNIFMRIFANSKRQETICLKMVNTESESISQNIFSVDGLKEYLFFTDMLADIPVAAASMYWHYLSW